MGLKKYEIITVGSDKRVRALRSWRVQDRYVNIGDVGGIVYDEKTLSQDGACWLFRGNFGFPGARIGGDSIVDVREGALAPRNYNVDILGSSTFVGGEVRFNSNRGATDSMTLTAADFEQGRTVWAGAGASYEAMKVPSNAHLRSKNPIFLGGEGLTLKCDVPGYAVVWSVFDRDMNAIAASGAAVNTGAGVTVAVPAGQYAVIGLSKNPLAIIVPSEATAAGIKYAPVYEGSLTIIDSRVEINPPTSNSYITWVAAGVYTAATGVSFQTVIRGSTLKINRDGAANTSLTTMANLINSTVTIDNAANPQVFGAYENVKNLTFSGSFSGLTLNPAVSTLIQAYDCDNMVVSSTVFPGLAAMQTAGVPIRFYNCNLNNGRFYHHAQIANTYKNIDFALAQADLGKTLVGSRELASSEVEGMYRIVTPASGLTGCLVESFASVEKLVFSNFATVYNTTIYKDAYLDGLFDFAGTNVFGNKVRSHPLAQVLNVQPRAVQGNFTLTAGSKPTLIPGSLARVVINYPIRINTANGITVSNIPAGIQAAFACVDGQGKYVVLSTWKEGTATVTNLAQLDLPAAYIMFKKANDGNITPEDLAGVTVTVYNGCKIVNTGATAVSMKGSIRVEDNATLVNASVTGSGYFGGNSVVYYNPTVWASLDFNGTVFMKDDAVFAPSALTGANALVRMEGKAKFTGSVDVASTNLSFIMRDNAVIEGKANTRSGVVMSGNSRVTATGQITAASRGVLVMEENASIEANTTAIGAITLSGNYKGNVVKTWTGKRTITYVNAPEYDNNVKTQYDF